MITISVRVNGSLAEAMGAARLMVRLPEQATLADLVTHLGERHPATEEILSRSVAMASGKHISRSTILSDGQELALLMPIAGG